MKSTILLTAALFLASAPSPDAHTMSEFSAGFLATSNDIGLTASEPEFNATPDSDVSAQSADLLAQEVHEPKSYKDG